MLSGPLRILRRFVVSLLIWLVILAALLLFGIVLAIVVGAFGMDLGFRPERLGH